MANRTSKLFLYLFLAILLGGAGSAAYLFYRDQNPPQLMLAPSMQYVGPSTIFNLVAQDVDSGIRSIRVDVTMNGTTYTVLERSGLSGAIQQEFTLADLPSAEGELLITATAIDDSLAHFGMGNTAQVSKSYIMDLTPPAIIPISTMHNVRQGGVGCITFALSEAAATAGVSLANSDYFFPAFKLENGDYACLFAFPYDMPVEEFLPSVTAIDAAGNRSNMTVPVTPLARNFKQDTINLPDSFLEKKFPEFATDFPQATTPLERYLLVNNQLRQENYESILDITSSTSPVPLWKGVFSRLPASAPRAGFADHRTYMYNGEAVDQQVHMGVDLASTRQAAIPAANSGKVIFTGELGIYGRTVIIDHGLGLHTLYSHLSGFSVAAGDVVEKDQQIGLTGMTGLAGGDHLHFAVLVGGVFVTPLEWWDPHWLQDNVTDRLPMVADTPDGDAEPAQ